MKKMTQQQEAFDSKWEEVIEHALENGFVIHEHKGVALIATHKIQLNTRSLTEYLISQIKMGIEPEQLGYPDARRACLNKFSDVV